MDANASFYFLHDVLGAVCQYSEVCNNDCKACGTARRASLPNATNSSYGCFGLHAVNSLTRVQGEVPMHVLDTRFDRAMGDYSAYVPLMDQATVIYAKNVTSHFERFENMLGSNGFLLLKWWNEDGDTFYSLIVKVEGQVCPTTPPPHHPTTPPLHHSTTPPPPDELYRGRGAVTQ